MEGACSATLPASDAERDAYACGIVSEYLSPAWAEHLARHMGVLEPAAVAAAQAPERHARRLSGERQESVAKKGKVCAGGVIGLGAQTSLRAQKVTAHDLSSCVASL